MQSSPPPPEPFLGFLEKTSLPLHKYAWKEYTFKRDVLTLFYLAYFIKDLVKLRAFEAGVVYVPQLYIYCSTQVMSVYLLKSDLIQIPNHICEEEDEYIDGSGIN
uniref:Uncharacterized protein n=1 Tax=Onchocerca volvulus TaxID=6282 RepID=A0A8R1TUQ3_ONCVO